MVSVPRQNKYHIFVLLSTYAYNFTEQKNWVAYSKNVSSAFGVGFELPNVKKHLTVSMKVQGKRQGAIFQESR